MTGDSATAGRGRLPRARPAHRLTQDEFAGMVGASRESVARALATLRSLGLVTTGRGHVDVQDLPGLRAYGG